MILIKYPKCLQSFEISVIFVHQNERTEVGDRSHCHAQGTECVGECGLARLCPTIIGRHASISPPMGRGSRIGGWSAHLRRCSAQSTSIAGFILNMFGLLKETLACGVSLWYSGQVLMLEESSVSPSLLH